MIEKQESEKRKVKTLIGGKGFENFDLPIVGSKIKIVVDLRDVPRKKKRENVGIFPKWGDPPPPVWE